MIRQVFFSIAIFAVQIPFVEAQSPASSRDNATIISLPAISAHDTSVYPTQSSTTPPQNPSLPLPKTTTTELRPSDVEAILRSSPQPEHVAAVSGCGPAELISAYAQTESLLSEWISRGENSADIGSIDEMQRQRNLLLTAAGGLLENLSSYTSEPVPGGIESSLRTYADALDSVRSVIGLPRVFRACNVPLDTQQPLPPSQRRSFEDDHSEEHIYDSSFSEAFPQSIPSIEQSIIYPPSYGSSLITVPISAEAPIAEQKPAFKTVWRCLADDWSTDYENCSEIRTKEACDASNVYLSTTKSRCEWVKTAPTWDSNWTPRCIPFSYSQCMHERSKLPNDVDAGILYYAKEYKPMLQNGDFAKLLGAFEHVITVWSGHGPQLSSFSSIAGQTFRAASKAKTISVVSLGCHSLRRPIVNKDHDPGNWLESFLQFPIGGKPPIIRLYDVRYLVTGNQLHAASGSFTGGFEDSDKMNTPWTIRVMLDHSGEGVSVQNFDFYDCKNARGQLPATDRAGQCFPGDITLKLESSCHLIPAPLDRGTLPRGSEICSATAPGAHRLLPRLELKK